MKFPEQFRVTNRVAGPYATVEGNPFGMFLISGRAANGRSLKVIAADGEETGWEHVSVSLNDHPNSCPSWAEMCAVKNLFWDASECIVQFHPAESDYVNVHNGCLHMWRCVNVPFPTPPTICV